jgi:hypothetical protein
MAGGEPRLGTASIYMAPRLAVMTLNGSEISQITWLQRDRKRGADAAENLGFYALRSKNFGLRGMKSRSKREG